VAETTQSAKNKVLRDSLERLENENDLREAMDERTTEDEVARLSRDSSNVNPKYTAPNLKKTDGSAADMSHLEKEIQLESNESDLAVEGAEATINKVEDSRNALKLPSHIVNGGIEPCNTTEPASNASNIKVRQLKLSPENSIVNISSILRFRWS